MISIGISAAAKAVNGRPTADGAFTGVFIDSRRPVKGGLFVCIEGDNFDGHDFARACAEAGAACIMARKHVYTDVPVIYVDDTRQALLALAKYYRSLFDIPVVGLTGSVGKTTTKDMTHAVLSAKYRTVKTQGNLNNDIGMPQTLFTIDADTQAAVVEMGMNHLGEISALTRVCMPTSAIITNVGVAHIENLGSREKILKAKLEITEGMKAGSPLIINADNDLLGTYADPGFEIVRFGIDADGLTVRAANIAVGGEGVRADFIYGGSSYPVFIPAIGRHYVYDALAAFCAGVVNGVAPEAAAAALADYVPSGMRGRVVKRGGVTFVEDCYNSNPDSAEASLKALMLIPAARHIAVLGDMLELGDYSETGHRANGRTAARVGVDEVYTYGERSRSTAGEARKNGAPAFEFEDQAALAAALKADLKPGDAVLFKASRGMKLENVIGMIYDE